MYSSIKLLRIKNCGRHVVVCPGLILRGSKYIELGDLCYFGPRCRIEAYDEYKGVHYEPKIEIGRDVRVNSTCHIGAINKIVIGEQCLLGSNVMIHDHSHGRNTFDESSIHPSERNLYSKGAIIIGKRCWLCENVVVLANVTIGDCCVIGANSVVTKDIPSYSVAVGNPAKVVRQIKKYSENDDR